MPKAPLKGVIAASVTPVTPAFEPDTQRLKAHADWLLASGCSYISNFGTTGEGASFSTAQKLAAMAELKAAGVDMGRMVPAVMTAALEEAAGTVIGYAELGCRAVLVLPPFYYSASEAGIAAYFDALIAATQSRTDVDLLLYNIPQLSGVRFTPSLVATLLERHRGRIAGIKDSTGDLQNGLALVGAFPELAIFTGDDRVLPRLVEKGGAGMIGGMPNVFAPDLVALYNTPSDGDRLEKQSRRIEAVDRYGSLVALKAALADARADEELARPVPPLVVVQGAERQALMRIFAETGFDPASTRS